MIKECDNVKTVACGPVIVQGYAELINMFYTLDYTCLKMCDLNGVIGKNHMCWTGWVIYCENHYSEDILI